MLTMLMMGADDDADDRENYINKLPNSRSTAPRAPNISSSSSSSSLRELGPVSTHDVLASWRGVGLKPRFTSDENGRDQVKMRRVARVVASVQINVFAM